MFQLYSFVRVLAGCSRAISVAGRIGTIDQGSLYRRSLPPSYLYINPYLSISAGARQCARWRSFAPGVSYFRLRNKHLFNFEFSNCLCRYSPTYRSILADWNRAVFIRPVQQLGVYIANTPQIHYQIKLFIYEFFYLSIIYLLYFTYLF